MKTVMSIGAHPDDMEFGCTGTIMQLLRRDYRGVMVLLTNGENGFKAGELPPRERVAVRKREQRKAAHLLGMHDIEFLDNQDGYLEYDEDLRRRLVILLRKYRPEIVFSFDPANQAFDNLNLFHRDHRIAAVASFDAVFAAKNPWIYPGRPHRVEEMWFYGSNSPDRFIDISEDIDRKLEILLCHRSQFPDPTRIESFIREVLSGPHGDYRHCERFRVLKIEQVT
jgi:LmbE family N-acetylglucosaminyl deacetylase